MCLLPSKALLADRKFRKKGLTAAWQGPESKAELPQAKARAIQDATGVGVPKSQLTLTAKAQLRLLPAEKLSSLRELPQLQEKEMTSNTSRWLSQVYSGGIF